MAKLFSKPIIVLIFALLLLPVIACNVGTFDLFSSTSPTRPPNYGILTPAENGLIQAGCPVHIQAAIDNPGDISSLEFSIKQGSQPVPIVTGQPDVPPNGVLLEGWTPTEPGNYQITVAAYYETAAEPTIYNRQVQIIQSNSVACPPSTPVPAAALSLTPTPTAPLVRCPAPAEVIKSLEYTSNEARILVGEPITLTWEVTGFTQFELKVAGPEDTGGAQAFVPVESFSSLGATAATHAARDQFVYRPPEAGSYIFRLEAAQGECVVDFQTAPVPVARVTVVEPTATPMPTPTPFFPPPPSAPGVPPGPTKAEIPAMSPPVCDAAEYLGVHTGGGDMQQRIFIPTDDQIPAKVVAGTLVHRAWRLRNIGTCTWGPGYELAFYGGRSMGSGGVAFESFFPNEPPRRNVVIDQNQIIAPEGKPNEIAVLELLLNTPTIPGIHQSYWRMRNPQGVYFGPIIGVTMDVVRECQSPPGGPIIYGAPVINRFRILGVDGELAPEGAGETLVFNTDVGQLVTLDWSLLNTTNFQIIVEDPTGNIQTISTTDTTGRANFTPTRVGTYTFTLYADNGSCAITQQLVINVRPPKDQQFVLDVVLSSASSSTAASASAQNVAKSAAISAGAVEIEWRHIDENADDFTLSVGRYKKERQWECTFFDYWCRWVESNWTLDETLEYDVGTNPRGTATISNLDSEVCPTPAQNTWYMAKYIMEARKDGQPADPFQSNAVDVMCNNTQTTQLPTEIE